MSFFYLHNIRKEYTTLRICPSQVLKSRITVRKTKIIFRQLTNLQSDVFVFKYVQKLVQLLNFYVYSNSTIILFILTTVINILSYFNLQAMIYLCLQTLSNKIESYNLQSNYTWGRHEGYMINFRHELANKSQVRLGCMIRFRQKLWNVLSYALRHLLFRSSIS